MSIAIFDLDGTLIEGQSQQYLIKYLYKKRYINIFQLVGVLLWFAAYKLSLVKNPKKMMERAFQIIEGLGIVEVDDIVTAFYQDVLKNKLFLPVIDRLHFHQKRKDKILLVTNSVEPLAKKVASRLGIKKVFATKLCIEGGIYNGRIKGEIVYGAKKTKLIKNLFSEDQLSDSYAYADHYSDASLLALATNSYLIKPTKKTLKFFKNSYKKNNIKIIK